MDNITIPNVLALILPILVTALSHYLRDAKLSPAINGLISLCAILITAVACVWLAGSWTANLRELTIVILAYVAYLMRNDYQALLSWLFAKDSPVAPSKPAIPQNATTTVVAPSGTFAYPIDQSSLNVATTAVPTAFNATQKLTTGQ